MGHPYEDFLRRRVVRKEKTITEQEKYIDALESEQMALRTSVVVIAVVLGLILYQWLVEGALSCHG